MIGDLEWSVLASQDIQLFRVLMNPGKRYELPFAKKCVTLAQ